MNRTQKNSSSDLQDAHRLLLQYCKKIPEWADNWSGSKLDLPIGASIVQEITPFLIDRIQKGRAKSTIKIYSDYLWALGGELIRFINEDESERKLSARQLILKYVSKQGGPYWRHARDERDRMHYDSVCRCLYKFMTNQP